MYVQDYKVLELAKDVIEGKARNVDIKMPISNEDRTFGATLSYYISMYVEIYSAFFYLI